jgi:hypothetical protein
MTFPLFLSVLEIPEIYPFGCKVSYIYKMVFEGILIIHPASVISFIVYVISYVL